MATSRVAVQGVPGHGSRLRGRRLRREGHGGSEELTLRLTGAVLRTDRSRGTSAVRDAGTSRGGEGRGRRAIGTSTRSQPGSDVGRAESRRPPLRAAARSRAGDTLLVGRRESAGECAPRAEGTRMPKSKGQARAPRKGRPVDPARRRYCSFCKEKVDEVDYKDVATLRRFVSDRGKIKTRRVSGACRRTSARSRRPSSSRVRWPCCRTWSPSAGTRSVAGGAVGTDGR